MNFNTPADRLAWLKDAQEYFDQSLRKRGLICHYYPAVPHDRTSIDSALTQAKLTELEYRISISLQELIQHETNNTN